MSNEASQPHLREDLAAERRVDDLLALVAEGQRQIRSLHGELADARTAAM